MTGANKDVSWFIDPLRSDLGDTIVEVDILQVGEENDVHIVYRTPTLAAVELMRARTLVVADYVVLVETQRRADSWLPGSLHVREWVPESESEAAWQLEPETALEYYNDDIDSATLADRIEMNSGAAFDIGGGVSSGEDSPRGSIP